MADTQTPNYGFVLPEPGGSDETWGDKLNANWTQIDALLKATFAPAQVPVGGIVMYNGLTAELPTNWKVCDGTEGTPDLRDKFIVGASAARPLGDTGGQFAITDVPAHTHGAGTLAAASGGAHTHTGTAAEAGAHTHDVRHEAGSATAGSNLAGSSLANNATSTAAALSAGAHTHTLDIAEGGAHTHAITGEVASAGVASVDITPPYYALIYIQRMS